MKRWTATASVNEDGRWKKLSEMVNAAGCENVYEPWPGSASGWDYVSGLEGYHHVRLSTRFGPDVLKALNLQSGWVKVLGVIDGMTMTDAGWWPQCALYESFGQILVSLGADLEFRGHVFIAGAGGAARTAIAAFFKAGFTKFLITNFTEPEAQQTIKDVKQRFFGLDIHWVPVEGIVLLPGECSVLVNCTPSVEENQLLIELSYLNFLKRPGFLFDLSRSPTPSLVVQEALDSGLQLVSGVEIASRADVMWAKWAFGVDLNLEAYTKVFQTTLGT